MSVARRANVVFAVVFVIALTVAGLVFSLAHGTAQQVDVYRARTDTLQTTMWSLRSGFYNYDDQMNMYVAVLAGGDPKQAELAETTYQQAVDARNEMSADLDLADRLTTDPKLHTMLARVRQDYIGYNGFADQTRKAAQAGDVKQAVHLATVGNLVPSNDMMPTLDQARALSRSVVAAELKGLLSRQHVMETVSVAFGLVVLVLLGLLRLGLQLFVLRPVAVLRDRMAGIATGVLPRTERVEAVRDDEFGQVATAFNAMLEALSVQEDETEREHREREAETQANVERTRAAERSVRDRAQAAVDENSRQVVDELNLVMSEVEAVRNSAAVIDDRVSAASARTRDVVEQARQAEQVVTALGNSLRRVGGMAQLIAGVADQTKLLALNATIEAARAGEAGRGFSVVAGEVKELATTTAQSTAEISSTIGSLEGNAAAMTTAISGMTEGIDGVQEATGVLGGVAVQQHQVVESLQQRVLEAIARIDSMGSMNERLERRRHERAFLPVPLRLTCAGQNFEAKLQDLSESGARCRLDAGGRLPGTAVGLEFSLGGENFTLQGTVVRRVDDGAQPSFGVEFLDLTEADRARLRTIVGAGAGD